MSEEAQILNLYRQLQSRNSMIERLEKENVLLIAENLQLIDDLRAREAEIEALHDALDNLQREISECAS